MLVQTWALGGDNWASLVREQVVDLNRKLADNLRKMGHWHDQPRWSWWFFSELEQSPISAGRPDWCVTKGGGWVYCDESGMNGPKGKCGGYVWDVYRGRWKQDRSQLSSPWNLRVNLLWKTTTNTQKVC